MNSDFEKLLALLRGEKAGSNSDFSPELVRIAKYHGVVPRLEGEGVKKAQIQNQIRALQNLRHLSSLLDLFSRESVQVLVVKGLALSARLYGDVGHRHTGDIDLWIPESEVEQVHRLLESTGHRGKTGYASLSPHFREHYRRRKFHIGFTHEDTGISVEIHWRLGATDQLFPISFKEALSESKSLGVGGILIPTLSDSHHLLFLYVHAARHFWERLFWLIDIVDYHKKAEAPSREQLLDLAAGYGIDRAVLAGMYLIDDHSLAGETQKSRIDCASRKLAKFGRRNLESGTPGSSPFSAMLSGLSLHRSFSHKWKTLMEGLTAADDWHRLKVPDGFGWLYLAVRPWFWFERRKFLTKKN